MRIRKFSAVAILIISSLCFAQDTIITNFIHIANHGGWGLTVNIGADKSDKIELDVKCDHPVKGWCFLGIPKLEDGTLFTLVGPPEVGHQKWFVLSPSRGDQFVTANYFWVGSDVHYELTIVATEVQ